MKWDPGSPQSLDQEIEIDLFLPSGVRLQHEGGAAIYLRQALLDEETKAWTTSCWPTNAVEVKEREWIEALTRKATKTCFTTIYQVPNDMSVPMVHEVAIGLTEGMMVAERGRPTVGELSMVLRCQWGCFAPPRSACTRLLARKRSRDSGLMATVSITSWWPCLRPIPTKDSRSRAFVAISFTTRRHWV